MWIHWRTCSVLVDFDFAFCTFQMNRWRNQYFILLRKFDSLLFMFIFDLLRSIGCPIINIATINLLLFSLFSYISQKWRRHRVIWFETILVCIIRFISFNKFLFYCNFFLVVVVYNDNAVVSVHHWTFWYQTNFSFFFDFVKRNDDVSFRSTLFLELLHLLCEILEIVFAYCFIVDLSWNMSFMTNYWFPFVWILRHQIYLNSFWNIVIDFELLVLTLWQNKRLSFFFELLHKQEMLDVLLLL